MLLLIKLVRGNERSECGQYTGRTNTSYSYEYRSKRAGYDPFEIFVRIEKYIYVCTLYIRSSTVMLTLFKFRPWQLNSNSVCCNRSYSNNTKKNGWKKNFKWKISSTLFVHISLACKAYKCVAILVWMQRRRRKNKSIANSIVNKNIQKQVAKWW